MRLNFIFILIERYICVLRVIIIIYYAIRANAHITTHQIKCSTELHKFVCMHFIQYCDVFFVQLFLLILNLKMVGKYRNLFSGIFRDHVFAFSFGCCCIFPSLKIRIFTFLHFSLAHNTI